LGAACSPINGENIQPATQVAKSTQTGKTLEPQSVHSLSPDTVLAQAVSTFKNVQGFRVHETLDPVSGSPATYEIEVLARDKERWISTGECANNAQGEHILIGGFAYHRCGAQPWLKTRHSGNTVRDSYLDYLQNSAGYSIRSLDSEMVWEIAADYHGTHGPPGTLIWLIRQQDLLPSKLTYLASYSLVSKFRDFDGSSMLIRAPVK
jgi:hypothetical protein